VKANSPIYLLVKHYPTAYSPRLEALHLPRPKTNPQTPPTHGVVILLSRKHVDHAQLLADQLCHRDVRAGLPGLRAVPVAPAPRRRLPGAEEGAFARAAWGRAGAVAGAQGD
jgi:hypothetical protein